jgi:spore germination protein YaaH
VTVDTGTATESRLRLLRPCPNQSNCWIYTIRSGDNLISIANFFGVPLARIYAMNPGLQGTTLRIGQRIEIPTPTR